MVFNHASQYLSSEAERLREQAVDLRRRIAEDGGKKKTLLIEELQNVLARLELVQHNLDTEAEQCQERAEHQEELQQEGAAGGAPSQQQGEEAPSVRADGSWAVE